jgi:hypothetical protein
MKKCIVLLSIFLIGLIFITGCENEVYSGPLVVSTEAEARERLQEWISNNPFSSPVTIEEVKVDQNGYNFSMNVNEETLITIRVVKRNGALLKQSGSNSISIQDWYEDLDASLKGIPPESTTYTPMLSPTSTPEPDAQPLLGTWLWMGSPYYVFEANGRGTMAGSDIHWSVNSGVLSICNTPAQCGNTCSLPDEWSFVIDGNQLTITSLLIPDFIFVYTRA